MTAHDIYPIARIVVAKDPLLAQKQLELATGNLDTKTGNEVFNL